MLTSCRLLLSWSAAARTRFTSLSPCSTPIDQKLTEAGKQPAGPDGQRRTASAASVATPSGQVIQQGHALLLSHPQELLDAFPDLADDLDVLGWQALACTPLAGPDVIIGTLRFAWDHPRLLDAGDLVVITALAAYVTDAL